MRESTFVVGERERSGTLPPCFGTKLSNGQIVKILYSELGARICWKPETKKSRQSDIQIQFNFLITVGRYLKDKKKTPNPKIIYFLIRVV